ncbi:hypothetical protein, partial [Klebsiella pneumoniae]|uniref:hypothetical protein n=5 Tax=Enterobacteriaceae TaxID=543 RepID=UPI001C52FD67
QEQESARGSYQGETPGIFIVLSGFAATDLSVRFRDACQGGGAYGKTAAPYPFFAQLVMPYAFALIRVQVTPAAAERQERQRPSERGGVISP